MVSYYHDRLNGCCGIEVVHDVSFTNKNNYKKFLKILHKIARDEGVCKIIMSDRQRPRNVASLYDFCMSTPGIQYGKPEVNVKTGNLLYIFEYNVPREILES